MTTGLSHRHHRFVVQGWVRYLQGLQSDLRDRFVADTSGTLTEHEDQALVIDAGEQPELCSALRERFDRQFYWPAACRWV
jgi:hypothetical protein